MIKDFEEFLKENIVVRLSPDTQRAKNLIIESERKYNILLELENKLGINNNNANDYVESCYNIILYFIRAKMIEEGYNSSGKGAHEAEISYALRLGLSLSDAEYLNQLRYFRNGILYYGKRFDEDYAKLTIAYTKKVYQNLRS